MLIKFEHKSYHQIGKEEIAYDEVWINPRFIVSINAIKQERYKGHTGITTCARESEEENQYFLVKGEAADVVKTCEIQHNG
jgi:hypothetical protein